MISRARAGRKPADMIAMPVVATSDVQAFVPQDFLDGLSHPQHVVLSSCPRLGARCCRIHEHVRGPSHSLNVRRKQSPKPTLYILMVERSRAAATITPGCRWAVGGHRNGTRRVATQVAVGKMRGLCWPLCRKHPGATGSSAARFAEPLHDGLADVYLTCPYSSKITAFPPYNVTLCHPACPPAALSSTLQLTREQYQRLMVFGRRFSLSVKPSCPFRVHGRTTARTCVPGHAA